MNPTPNPLASGIFWVRIVLAFFQYSLRSFSVIAPSLSASILFITLFSTSFQLTSTQPVYAKPCNVINPKPAMNTIPFPIFLAVKAEQYPMKEEKVSLDRSG
eukprot:CAMPEP_0196186034 /NCGR_PEP_ID=MMETSP0911-20130528/37462_1 /TAXON_ID=49265 /ORGANISM="Thalassiosira rotula, Strain GSO102" /LENGTH=101 /DNA_ID=CAMNT_0041456713 /DNA_START=256 /DNA_END=558 /DNA_ORIENTATION=+